MIGDDTKENIFPRITGAVTTRGVTYNQTANRIYGTVGLAANLII